MIWRRIDYDKAIVLLAVLHMDIMVVRSRRVMYRHLYFIYIYIYIYIDTHGSANLHPGCRMKILHPAVMTDQTA
jgi:hypothetical protein